MRRIGLFIIVCLLSLFVISCGDDKNPIEEDKSYTLSFYIDGKLIDEIKYIPGKTVGVNYPCVDPLEGYYAEWNKEIPSEISDDMIFTCEIKEKKKQYNFIIDGISSSTKIVKYHEEVENPEYVKEDGVKSFEWVEEFIGEEDHVLKYNRTLIKEYETFTVKFIDYEGNVLDTQTVVYGKSAKTPELEDEYSWEKVDYSKVTSNLVIKGRKIGASYTISYMDGTTALDLDPQLYVSGIGLSSLPTPTKEGYAFVGWFVSEISLYPYTKISEEAYGNIVLRARFVEIETHNPITLPAASGHITNIKKVAHSSGNGTYVYQPEVPSGFSTSVTLYSWSSSDTSIATISQYSSITGKKAGCCVITGTLNSDPTVTINGLIRVTGDGIVAVTEEEANKITTYTVTFLGKNDEVINTQKVLEGGSAVCPIPPVIDGYAFMGWDKECYNIKEDTTIKAKYRKGTNNYTGKKIAIIGDSISTYQDYIPSGYACFYPYPTADVTDVNMTWWMMMVNRLGAGLFINNSYSGSCAAESTGTSASSNKTRLQKLVVGEERPDVVIIYMGSNDCGSKYVSEDQFSSGYNKTIALVRELCPNAEIILCTLPKSNLYTEDNRIAYNNIILRYAESYSFKVCNLAEVDLNGNLVDSAHPKTSGMRLVANKMVEDLLK